MSARPVERRVAVTVRVLKMTDRGALLEIYAIQGAQPPGHVRQRWIARTLVEPLLNRDDRDEYRERPPLDLSVPQWWIRRAGWDFDDAGRVVLYYLDAWKNVSKAGKPYLSVKIGSPKGRQPGDDDHKGDPSAPEPAPRGASAAAEFDDDIPF